MTLPFGDLNMCDAEHVAWVKSQRDPELWHAAAICVLVYLGDPQRFLLWLIDQPEMDRATAGYVFLGREGQRYLQGQKEFYGEGLSGDDLRDVHEALCRRGATTGFTNDTIGLHPGFESDRRACLDLVARGAVAEGIPVPHAIIDTPFPAERKTAYVVEDGTILQHEDT
jgi:hypothetical protein